ncbi:MAG TPA: PP2C family protein-serine/threonine phosphatase [Planctomycetota bacterium]|nr:PP2C family protein-serine/threonine phosphatase [Planctomycetota bacterium]
MSLHGRGRPLKRPLGRDSETRKPLHTPPPMPAAGASAQSSVSLLRLKAQKRLQLRQRMGLLKHKNADEDLSDVERKMLDHELAIAEELQANLLPRKVPQIPGYDVSAYYRPSREVGGDYYDFIEIDADHLGILVADVSGKGIPGSIVMTETRALVKSEAVRTLSPAETLTRVNRVLYHDIKRGMFVTVYYCILQLNKMLLTCVSAGHNPMVLWRKASNTCHLVNPNGLALGIDKGPLFDKTLKEQKIQLFKGDRFALYTDGVIESMNKNNEQFGQNRFYLRVKQLADKSSSEFLSLLVSELEAHQGEAPQHDDITIVTGRTVAEEESAKEPIIEG